MNVFFKKLLVGGFLALPAVILDIANAAQRTDLHLQNLETINQQYKEIVAALGPNTRPEERHAEMLGLHASSSLRLVETLLDPDGATHYSYQQMFRGLPVFGQTIFVSESQSGVLSNLSGHVVYGLEIDLLNKDKLLFREMPWLPLRKHGLLNEASTGTLIPWEKSKRVVFVDNENVAHFAFYRELRPDRNNEGNLSTTFAIVDATSGQVLKQWDDQNTPKADDLNAALAAISPSSKANRVKLLFGGSNCLATALYQQSVLYEVLWQNYWGCVSSGTSANCMTLYLDGHSMVTGWVIGEYTACMTGVT